jgi:pyocin large subunit-like protein
MKYLWLLVLLLISCVGAQRSGATAVGFTSQASLESHFRKHRRDFPGLTLQAYLRKAQELRDAPLGNSILEGTRRDTVITRYHKRERTFVAFNRDRRIRTFFKPNDGEAYFWRQLRP